MKPYCIIPARANSKGLPNKNVLFFDDKPLILHTVDQAIESGLFNLEDIIVSSDSKEYLKMCDTRGVTTLLRPEELALDASSSYDVLEYLFRSLDNSRPFVLLQVTSPLRKATHIREAYDLFLKQDKKTVVSMKDVGVDLRITTRLDENNKVVDGKMLDKGIRRQDGDIYYRPNGAIYISMIDDYLKTGSFVKPETTAYIMSQNDSLDIDDYDDFVLATLYKKSLNKKVKKLFNQDNFVKRVIECKEDNVLLTDARYKKIIVDNFTSIVEANLKVKNIFQNIDLLAKFKHIMIWLNLDEYASFTQCKSYLKKLLNDLDENQKITIVLPIVCSYSIEYNNPFILACNEELKALLSKSNVNFIDLNEKLATNGVLDFTYCSDGVHLNSKGVKKVQSVLSKHL